jgi:exosortase/archaeosortase family protein
LKTRLVIWCLGCLAISILAFSELWVKPPQWFSLEGLQRHGVFHWGILGLCILWLWLKRKDILPRMQTQKFSPPFIIAGVALVLLSIFLPRSDDFLLFLMLMGWLGIFALIFAGASILPSILLAIYGFSVLFPILMDRWSGEPSSMFVANTVTGITGIFGLPITNNGVVIHLTNPSGDSISTTVVPGCAGYATIGVFIALFALMMLDIRLPLKKTWYIFLIGLAGTWLQNIIRVVISVVAGYYWGSGALEAMHYNAAYVIFPLWYALFAYIYLRQTGWRKGPVREKSEGMDT